MASGDLMEYMARTKQPVELHKDTFGAQSASQLSEFHHMKGIDELAQITQTINQADSYTNLQIVPDQKNRNQADPSNSQPRMHIDINQWNRTKNIPSNPGSKFTTPHSMIQNPTLYKLDKEKISK